MHSREENPFTNIQHLEAFDRIGINIKTDTHKPQKHLKFRSQKHWSSTDHLMFKVMCNPLSKVNQNLNFLNSVQ